MSDGSAFPDPRETLEVDVDFVSRLLKSEPAAEPFALLDCREEDEFQYCRIDGARLMPLSTFGEIKGDSLGDRDRLIVIYCHHGMRSAQAASFLRQRGFPNAFSMQGGIEVWSTEIDPAVPRY